MVSGHAEPKTWDLQFGHNSRLPNLAFPINWEFFLLRGLTHFHIFRCQDTHIFQRHARRRESTDGVCKQCTSQRCCQSWDYTGEPRRYMYVMNDVICAGSVGSFYCCQSDPSQYYRISLSVTHQIMYQWCELQHIGWVFCAALPITRDSYAWTHVLSCMLWRRGKCRTRRKTSVACYSYSVAMLQFHGNNRLEDGQGMVHSSDNRTCVATI